MIACRTCDRSSAANGEINVQSSRNRRAATALVVCDRVSATSSACPAPNGYTESDQTTLASPGAWKSANCSGANDGRRRAASRAGRARPHAQTHRSGAATDAHRRACHAGGRIVARAAVVSCRRNGPRLAPARSRRGVAFAPAGRAADRRTRSRRRSPAALQRPRLAGRCWRRSGGAESRARWRVPSSCVRLDREFSAGAGERVDGVPVGVVDVAARVGRVVTALHHQPHDQPRREVVLAVLQRAGERRAQARCPPGALLEVVEVVTRRLAATPRCPRRP